MSDIFVLYDIDLQQIKDSVNPQSLIKLQQTMGAIEEPLFSHILHNFSISKTELENIITKTLQMYHLAEAIMLMFDQNEEIIKLLSLFQRLARGQYYQKLQEQNPVWLLTNRHTPQNIKIIMAATLIKASKNMSLQEIKQTVMVFTLEEKKSRTNGIPLTSKKIINILRLLNRTMPISFLQGWIKSNKFDIQGFILAHQFLYLCCLSSDRGSYLRLIPRVSYKRQKNPHTHLYQLQPINEITGTPDSKIQQKMKENNVEEIKKQGIKEKKSDDKIKIKQNISKSHKNLTKIQSMLRDKNIYYDIKKCLNGFQRSSKLSSCMRTIKSTTSTTRPMTAIHPLRIKQIVTADISYFDFDHRNTPSRGSSNVSQTRSRNVTNRGSMSFQLKDSLNQIVRRETDSLNLKIRNSIHHKSGYFAK